ncbi:unnamed protein product [Haemonchus placei]|uniref:HMG box domain-containing protein n=1 Tax=Haemonchus placei TaxID=6290 RepID=A0A0N4X6A7_HAEPC|nr:unnamed protein product [Haemonchus placei]
MATTLSQALLRNTYIDNVFHGVSNSEERKKFHADSKELFRKADMNLRQYASNSSELNELFATKEGTIPSAQKLLGLKWDIRKDTLAISFPRKTSRRDQVDKTEGS